MCYGIVFLLAEDSIEICHRSSMITLCNLDPNRHVLHIITHRWPNYYWSFIDEFTTVYISACCLLDVHQGVTTYVCEMCAPMCNSGCTCGHVCSHEVFQQFDKNCCCILGNCNTPISLLASYLLKCIFIHFPPKTSFSSVFSSVLQFVKHFQMLSAFSVKLLLNHFEKSYIHWFWCIKMVHHTSKWLKNGF